MMVYFNRFRFIVLLLLWNHRLKPIPPTGSWMGDTISVSTMRFGK
jgi:hypothetical protein